jgi:periplasmic divalent cation tolerance protein
MTEECLHVLTTIDSEDGAHKLQRVILEERAAACVQVLAPIRSAYWWKGQIEEAQEWLCAIKTRGTEYRRLESLIKENHPYETPEIIAIRIIAGNEDYLEWIKAETTP